MKDFLDTLIATRSFFGAEWHTIDDVISANRLGLPYGGMTTLRERFGITKRLMLEVVGLTPKSDELRRKYGQLDPNQSTPLLRLAHICYLANELHPDPATWVNEPLDWLNLTPVEAAQYEPAYLVLVFKLLRQRARKS